MNFRLSEEEFESMREACMADGARSLSDFARSVVCSALGAHHEVFSLREGMRRIDTRLDTLQREVKELTEMLGSCNPLAPPQVSKGAAGK